MITEYPAEHRRYDQPEYEPFWAAAAALDLPLSLHTATRRQGKIRGGRDRLGMDARRSGRRRAGGERRGNRRHQHRRNAGAVPRACRGVSAIGDRPANPEPLCSRSRIQGRVRGRDPDLRALRRLPDRPKVDHPVAIGDAFGAAIPTGYLPSHDARGQARVSPPKRR
jgi:hypothetical protein